jgi:preprotein translocase subunit SecD
MAPVVAEKVDGNEVACLQVGPPGLDADDVATASARLDRSGGRWEVEFALTTEGASRLSALRRDADPDGQVAILVDGQVVSVPKLADGPTTRGIVPGLDEASARRLADRLRR